MRRIFSLFAFFLTFIMASTATHTFRVKVGQFDKLSVFDNVHVVYHANPDSTGYAVYKADESLADVFIFTNEKGSLKIRTATEEVTEQHLPVIHVYSDYLTCVNNSTEFCVRVLSNAPVPRFTARLMGNGEIIAENIRATEVEANFVTGNGTILLSGKCNSALYRMVGTGTIQADELKADKVNCKIMGGGNIGCWAQERLDVRGIGSTRIYYKGKPKIKKVGGGKIIPLTAATEEELESKIKGIDD